MGKIHIRGGSPLRLVFEDPNGVPIRVRLKRNKKEPGEYFVINTKSGKPCQVVGRFKQTRPGRSEQACVISYRTS